MRPAVNLVRQGRSAEPPGARLGLVRFGRHPLLLPERAPGVPYQCSIRFPSEERFESGARARIGAVPAERIGGDSAHPDARIRHRELDQAAYHIAGRCAWRIEQPARPVVPQRSASDSQGCRIRACGPGHGSEQVLLPTAGLRLYGGTGCGPDVLNSRILDIGGQILVGRQGR